MEGIYIRVATPLRSPYCAKKNAGQMAGALNVYAEALSRIVVGFSSPLETALQSRDPAVEAERVVDVGVIVRLHGVNKRRRRCDVQPVGEHIACRNPPMLTGAGPAQANFILDL